VGQALLSGLRMAWRLSRRTAEHRLGTAAEVANPVPQRGKDVVRIPPRGRGIKGGHTRRDAKGPTLRLIGDPFYASAARAVPALPGEFVE